VALGNPTFEGVTIEHNTFRNAAAINSSKTSAILNVTVDTLAPRYSSVSQIIALRYNNFINTSAHVFHMNLQVAEAPVRFVTLPPNYFGSNDTMRVPARILDGYQSLSFLLVKVKSALVQPVSETCATAADCPVVDLPIGDMDLPVCPSLGHLPLVAFPWSHSLGRILFA
jgi:hypothetical protein